MSEIWKTSEPGAGPTSHEPPKTESHHGMVILWWALFLLGNWVSTIASRLLLRGDTASELLTATYFYIGAAVIDIIGIVVTILMVRKISQNQELKYNLLRQPESVAPEPIFDMKDSTF